MHEYLAAAQTKNAVGLNPSELFVGDVIQAAMQAGLQVETVSFPAGAYLDIGTPEDLVKVVHNSIF